VKRYLLLAALAWLAILTTGTPVYAQGLEPGVWTETIYMWALISGAGALAIAAALGAYSQSRAVTAACEGISRNPGASPQIRFALLLGLVLIESLVIYVFVISLSIIFVKWPA
jgi:F-type H+-transporting ATPase subunit c